jgi:hypothetical protein
MVDQEPGVRIMRLCDREAQLAHTWILITLLDYPY